MNKVATIRIGMWNRIAIAASALASLVLPTLAWMDVASMNADARKFGLASCRTEVYSMSASAEVQDTVAACDKLWLPINAWQPGWDLWAQLFGFTVIACALAYGVIWLLVWSVKRILRGRAA